jgi:hypothetical protein
MLTGDAGVLLGSASSEILTTLGLSRRAHLTSLYDAVKETRTVIEEGITHAELLESIKLLAYKRGTEADNLEADAGSQHTSLDPFTERLSAGKRRGPSGRSGSERPPAPQEAGVKNENTLEEWAKKHIPDGMGYRRYARTGRAPGCDAAYYNLETDLDEIALEFKSSRNYELKGKQLLLAEKMGDNYWVITPFGYDPYEPSLFVDIPHKRRAGRV